MAHMPKQNEPRVRIQGIFGLGSVRIRIRPEDLTLARGSESASPPAEGRTSPDSGDLQGVYIISVAARLLEMHPQTLRKYERLGLLRPSRTIGMLRLYSEEDIAKLRLIRHLEENLGLNLAGVELTLNLLSQLLDMLDRLSGLEEAEPFLAVVEQQMAQLLRSLDLPLQE